MVDNEKIKSFIDEIYNDQDIYNSKFYDWLRNLVSISTALLGILISFKSDDNCDCLKHYVFGISISLLSLSILCGITVLYGEARTVFQKVTKKVKHLRKLYNDPSLDYEKDVINRLKIFVYAEKISFVSFVLSFALLCIYSFL